MKRATEASLPSTLPGAVYLSCVKEACPPAPGEEAVRTPSVFHQLHRKVPPACELFGGPVVGCSVFSLPRGPLSASTTLCGGGGGG